LVRRVGQIEDGEASIAQADCTGTAVGCQNRDPTAVRAAVSERLESTVERGAARLPVSDETRYSAHDGALTFLKSISSFRGVYHGPGADAKPHFA